MTEKYWITKLQIDEIISLIDGGRFTLTKELLDKIINKQGLDEKEVIQ